MAASRLQGVRGAGTVRAALFALLVTFILAGCGKKTPDVSEMSHRDFAAGCDDVPISYSLDTREPGVRRFQASCAVKHPGN